jgi:hypothetical protein
LYSLVVFPGFVPWFCSLAVFPGCVPWLFCQVASLACHPGLVPIQPHQEVPKREANWLRALAFELVVIRTC